MRTTIQSLFVILPLLAAGCSIFGTHHPASSSDADRLEMKLDYIDLEDAKFGGQKAMQMDVQIRNVGHTTVQLPTKSVGPIIATDGGITSVTFTPDLRLTTEDGFRMPFAKSALAIVEVRPREAVILSYTFEKPAPVISNVTYKISPEFADRYGTWHGEITGLSTPNK